MMKKQKEKEMKKTTIFSILIVLLVNAGLPAFTERDAGLAIKQFDSLTSEYNGENGGQFMFYMLKRSNGQPGITLDKLTIAFIANEISTGGVLMAVSLSTSSMWQKYHSGSISNQFFVTLRIFYEVTEGYIGLEHSLRFSLDVRNRQAKFIDLVVMTLDKSTGTIIPSNELKKECEKFILEML